MIIRNSTSSRIFSKPSGTEHYLWNTEELCVQAFCKTKRCDEKRTGWLPSLCLGMRGDEVDSKTDGVDLVRFVIRDLKSKLFLQRHHDFYSVQTVEAKVILEMSSWCHLHTSIKHM
ncbi:acyl carrier protein 2, mitochondrial-like [Iris pallida]|uniref:Acyl carrier protein 2, mitochondrial-like n=1 Tax=Iris pallida TaxID=29817 RepID=A0AAX6HCP3_IRIPA|nr:acyl carrier protein 2, mitochondrial-like [Iris pallida]